MTFPEGVDYGQFYRACKSKGIKVTSRLAGVSITVMHGTGVKFQAQIRIGGTVTHLGCFPLTPEGEVMAHNRYMEAKQSQPQGKGTGLRKKKLELWQDAA